MSRGVLPAILLASVAIYLLRLDAAAGLYIDDAWYMVLAQALARGDGYRLISSATTPILPAVPPGFPLLLAPVFALGSQFPSNVPALKAVSIVAMFGVGIATYRYLTRYRDVPPAIAALIAAIVLLTPAFVFLATSTVMAEPVFVLSQMAMACSVERAIAVGPQRHSRHIVLSGVLAAASVLIRTAGIAGVAGAAVYLCWRQGLRTAAKFTAVCALAYLPWVAYAVTHSSSVADRQMHGGSIAFRYDELLRMRRPGETSSGTIDLRGFVSRVGHNISEVVDADVGALVLPGGVRGAVESGTEAFLLSSVPGTGMGDTAAMRWISRGVLLITLAGFVTAAISRLTVAELISVFTIAMVVVVAAPTYRYLLPVAPFLIAYFLQGLETIAASLRGTPRTFGAPSRVAVVCILGLFAIEHAHYITLKRFGPPPTWLRGYEEVKEVTDWLQANASREGPIASSNPGLVYLATNRKGVALSVTAERWQQLQALGAPYAVALRVAELPPPGLDYTVVHTSPLLKLWVVEIPPAVTDRK